MGDESELQTELGPAALPATRPVRISPGDRVGRFVVERRLGRGGMAVVYLARDPDLDRLVAIKVLRPELQTGRSRLLREAQAVARLVHPNVVTVYEVGALGDDLFMAMEYVAGQTVGEWLASGVRPWGEVLAVFQRAGRGLAAAHRAGIVHRDFKPDNVLRGDDGRVVVSDFGLARSEGDDVAVPSATDDPDDDQTQTAGVVGTPAYMSPEQMRGQPLDPRADQFSFCVALWQGLFGARPFEPLAGAARTIEGLARAIDAGAIVEPREHPVPSRVVAALRRGLSARREDRFGSMSALLAALRPTDRRPVVFAAAGTLGVVGLLGALAARAPDPPDAHAACLAGGRRVDDVWNATKRAAYVAAGDARSVEDARWFDDTARAWTTAWRDGCQASLAPEPQGRECLDGALAALARAHDRPDRAWWPVLEAPAACLVRTAPQVRELRHGLGNLGPTGQLEPGGRRIAFASGAELQAVIRDDGDSAPSAILAGTRGVLDWSADGAALLARVDGGVARIDVATGARTSLPWPEDVIAAALQPAQAARRDGDDLVVLDGEGAPRMRVAIAGTIRRAALEPGRGRLAVTVDGGDGWRLVVVDPAAGAHTTTPLGIHGDAGNVMAIAWTARGGVVVGGSARPDDADALWWIPLDAAGALAGAPIALVAPREHVVMDVLDVEGHRALALLVDMPRSLVRLRGGATTPIPGLLRGPVRGADPTRGLIVVEDGAQLRLIGPDGLEVASRPLADDAFLRDGALWTAGRVGSDLVLTGGDPAATLRFSGALPVDPDRVRCSGGDARRCFVSWIVAGVVHHAVLGDRRIGRAFVAPADVRDFAVAPDASRAIEMSVHELAVLDLTTGARKVIHRDDTCSIERAQWLPSGTAVVYGLECGEATELRVQAPRAGAPSRTVARVDAYVTGIAPLGDDDLVYSTLAYDSRLVVIDDLP